MAKKTCLLRLSSFSLATAGSVVEVRKTPSQHHHFFVKKTFVKKRYDFLYQKYRPPTSAISYSFNETCRLP